MQGTTRLIKTWATGQLTQDVTAGGQAEWPGSLAIVTERADQVDALAASGVVTIDSRVFVAGAAEESTSGPIIIGYQGSLSEPGGDVQIGADFFLQVHDYGTSEYLSLIGATIVRVTDETDFGAFLDDADRAFDEGEFPDFATHPLVRLCDASSLGSPQIDLGPKLRLYVDAEDGVSTSPSGSRLGDVGSSLDDLQSTWASAVSAETRSCGVSLAAAVPEPVRLAGLGERPWLSSYHSALAGVREVRSRNLSDFNDLRVSGFGSRMVTALGEITEPVDLNRRGSPVLVYSDEHAFVYDIRTEKIFQLELPAASIAEHLLVLGTADRAKELADEARVDAVARFFSTAGVPLTAS